MRQKNEEMENQEEEELKKEKEEEKKMKNEEEKEDEEEINKEKEEEEAMGTSVRYRFGSPLSSEKVVVCGHCLVTLSITSY